MIVTPRQELASKLVFFSKLTVGMLLLHRMSWRPSWKNSKVQNSRKHFCSLQPLHPLLFPLFPRKLVPLQRHRSGSRLRKPRMMSLPPCKQRWLCEGACSAVRPCVNIIQLGQPLKNLGTVGHGELCIIKGVDDLGICSDKSVSGTMFVSMRLRVLQLTC